MDLSAGIALGGFVVGAVVGLTGVGGAILMTPMLMVFGVPPLQAVGTDLLYGSMTKAFGAARNLRDGDVDAGWVKWLALGSIPGAALGGVGLGELRASSVDVDEVVRLALGGVLMVAAASNVGIEWLRRRGKAPSWDWTPTTTPRRVRVVLAGLVIGALVGLTSVGSGVLVAVLLMLASPLGPRVLIGTDLAHAALLLGAAAITHLRLGTVDLGLAVNLLIGSLPGVWLGSHWKQHVPAAQLRVALTACIFLGGIKLLAFS
jgi:uncharacterized membrane protein YfcA